MISKSHFIGTYAEDVTQYYTFIKELGRGTYGIVYRVQSILTGQIYACKKLKKKDIVNKDRFITEINLLKATDHPHIIKLYDIFEDKIFLYFIMEECLGGDFFGRLAARTRSKKIYTEKEAAHLFKQIISSVNYLHFHGVCHRDLKPENILFSTIREDSPLKLIDFGLSKINLQENMSSIVGTAFYMAPEVFLGKYNEKCDVWSCGVILYIMLCGRPPFYHTDEKQLIQLIMSMDYHFNYTEFKNVSSDAKQLIQSILVEADCRPSAQDILEHDWLKNYAPHSTDEALLIDWSHVQQYAKLNIIQKSVINFTAFRLSENETATLANIFTSLDTNYDGVLSLDEIQEGVKRMNMNSSSFNPDDLYQLFIQLDVDKNGLVNWNEFLAALYDYERCMKNEQIVEAFKSFDSDKSGKVNFKELCKIIKPNDIQEKKYLESLFNQLDKNDDGEIDYEEFINGLNLIPQAKLSKNQIITAK